MNPAPEKQKLDTCQENHASDKTAAAANELQCGKEWNAWATVVNDKFYTLCIYDIVDPSPWWVSLLICIPILCSMFCAYKYFVKKCTIKPAESASNDDHYKVIGETADTA